MIEIVEDPKINKELLNNPHFISILEHESILKVNVSLKQAETISNVLASSTNIKQNYYFINYKNRNFVFADVTQASLVDRLLVSSLAKTNIDNMINSVDLVFLRTIFGTSDEACDAAIKNTLKLNTAPDKVFRDLHDLIHVIMLSGATANTLVAAIDNSKKMSVFRKMAPRDMRHIKVHNFYNEPIVICNIYSKAFYETGNEKYFSPIEKLVFISESEVDVINMLNNIDINMKAKRPLPKKVLVKKLYKLYKSYLQCVKRYNTWNVNESCAIDIADLPNDIIELEKRFMDKNFNKAQNNKQKFDFEFKLMSKDENFDSSVVKDAMVLIGMENVLSS